MRRGIAVGGSLLADIFYNCPTFPSEGTLVKTESRGISVGGTGNIIIDLAKIDSSLPVSALAKIGKDEAGKEILSALEKYPSLDLSNIVTEGESSRTMVINSNDSNQRTFFYIPAASDDFSIDNIPFDKLNSRIFLLEYLLLMEKVDSADDEYGTHGARILAEARGRGMVTSVDIVSEAGSRAREVVSAALKYTDICCINELEASAVTGIDITDLSTLTGEGWAEKIKPVFDAIKEMGVTKWIVIHTRDIAFGYDLDRGEMIAKKSLSLPGGYIKGSTGAGDAYLCGILYGAHEGIGLEESMRIARSAAAASLSENNGTDGMRPLKEIMKLDELYSD